MTEFQFIAWWLGGYLFSRSAWRLNGPPEWPGSVELAMLFFTIFIGPIPGVVWSILYVVERTFPPKREYKLYEGKEINGTEGYSYDWSGLTGEVDPRSRYADTNVTPSGKRIE